MPALIAPGGRLLALALCLMPSLATAQPLQPVQILHQFTTPASPDGGLFALPDGSLYGVTSDAVYRVAPGGQVNIVGLITGGTFASGTLALGPDGDLYGTTQLGGTEDRGTVRFDPVTGDVKTLHAFGGASASGEVTRGLTTRGGFLYGVAYDQLFRVDTATGATTIEFRFKDPFRIPNSPLILGADGLLYGTTSRAEGESGAIYSFDPAAPDRITVRHVFTDAGFPQGRLSLGADGRLYGTEGESGAFFVYRFDPATGTHERIYTFSSVGPGAPALLATAGGSLYGTTLVTLNGGLPSGPSVLFRLRPGAGGYAYEALRTFDVVTTGLSSNAELALGADGLIYGYSQYGGPAGNGAVYRFDPGEGGPPADPLAFTVVHTFAPATTWSPSAPVPGADGLLYGTTSGGGPTQRGAFYVVDPMTGAIAFPASIPGAPLGYSIGSNPTPTIGLDGALYTASLMRTTPLGTSDTSIVRFVPSAGTAAIVPLAGPSPVPCSARMTRVPSGELYFACSSAVWRYEPGTETLTKVTDFAGPRERWTTSVPSVGIDGRVYIAGEGSFTGLSPADPPSYSNTRLLRLDPVEGSGRLEVTPGGSVSLGGLTQGADGAFYVGGSSAGSHIWRIEPDTFRPRLVCSFAAFGLGALSTAPDGRIVGVTFSSPQKLLLCTPATGAVETRLLPPTIGLIREPLVAVGGTLYGATSRCVASEASPRPCRFGGALIRLDLDASPPTLDTDADGLSNEWEARYGLNPSSGSADDGASGDPDGDGVTNAQELAAGSHPRGFFRRYFAEGATGTFFRTRIDLANPSETLTATVVVAFFTDTGEQVMQDLVLTPMSRVSIDPSTRAPVVHASFSTVIESDTEIVAERTMTWDASGYGSHIETAIIAPASTWYLAEGSTSGPFVLFYLLQNPQPVPVTATVRYLRPPGFPPIERTYVLLPHSRRTIGVDDEGADLASTDVSAVITAAAPIVAERAMYYSQPEQVFAAGHESAGVTAPALEWFFAEGATGPFFDLFLLIANPNTAAAAVEVEYLLPGGGSLVKTYTAAGNARTTIWVDDEQLPADSGLRPLANAAVSMRVRSLNGVPIVAERTMWWPGPSLTPAFWYEAHNSPGATAPAYRWAIAGGDIGGSSDAQTYVLIANPGDTAGRAWVRTLTTAGWTARLVDLPARSRTNVVISLSDTSGLEGPFSIVVDSRVNNTQAVPIVVEHSTYSSPGGVVWAAGGNALATPLP